MELDAIIIADSGAATYSQTSPMRLNIKNQSALIQTLRNFCQGNPADERPSVSWQEAPRLNGVALWDFLSKSGVSAAMVNNFYSQIDLFTRLIDHNPKYIIISTTFILTKKELLQITKHIRKLTKEAIIIVGGTFIYTSYLLSLKKDVEQYDTESPKKDYLFLEFDPQAEPLVDYYIISPSGMSIMTKLIHQLKYGQSVSSVPNIAIKQSSGYCFGVINTEAAYEREPIDWKNLPSRLFENQVMGIQASNGCPYNCAYCNFVKDLKATYIKPLDMLVQELKVLQSRGIRFVRFVDDNLRLGAPDLLNVCQRFIDERIDLKWMSFLRLNSLSGLDLDVLKRAGCIEVQMGLESANRQVLQNMNKRIDPDLYFDTIRSLLATGINVSACFIVGFPGETETTVDETIRFINAVSAPALPGNFTWNAFPFMLAPLSPIYEPEKRNQYDLHGYMSTWRHATMDSETAHGLIKKFYSHITNSSPTYSGDDLDLMCGLSDRQRKQFLLLRFELSKKRLRKESLTDDDILAQFNSFFNERV